MITSSSPCPCGSVLTYEHCCEPLHEALSAATPEALMRSRYTAFVLRRNDYIAQTWHPSTRPAQLQVEEGPQWTSLQILAADQQGDKGRVHFRAVYKAGTGWGFLEEVSSFIYENDRWFYLAGDTREGQFKPGRNDACPCGSGRKYKACCL